MLPWLSAVLVALAVGGAGTWLAQGRLRRRDESAAGITALSALSWREFVGIVLEALGKRGYRRVGERGDRGGDADLTLSRDGELWLLSAKHGSAFVLGRHAVDELAATMGVAGVSGGLLVTQGRIDAEGREAARAHRIELLDGATLWPVLEPLLPQAVVTPIRTTAARRARERTLLGWLLALLAGALVLALGTLFQPGHPESTLPPSGSGQPVAEPPVEGTLWKPAPDTPDPDPDAATLEAQRIELAASVSGLPMVARARWLSASTLEVVLADNREDPVAAICPRVVRYAALAASRIQLTPPLDSGDPVRFRQCRSY